MGVRDGTIKVQVPRGPAQRYLKMAAAADEVRVPDMLHRILVEYGERRFPNEGHALPTDRADEPQLPNMPEGEGY